MTREEQIKQYCADNGFPYGACGSISSLKANIATEAIKWADKHPNGSLIEWQKGEPKERGVYLVTYQFELSPYTTALFYIGGVWLNGDWLECPKRNIKAWCKLSDIEPYKEENK